MKAPEPPPPPAVVMRRRAQLALIALLFVGPLALAFWAYYSAELGPSGHTNRGELVTPARPLPEAILATPGGTLTTAALLHGHWSLVYVTGTACDRRCLAALQAVARVRQALGADSGRVRRVLLVDAPCCELALEAAAREQLSMAWLAGQDGRRVLAMFPATGGPAAESGRTWVVDPLGNLMMSYVGGAADQDLLRDLEHLLKLSHIG